MKRLFLIALPLCLFTTVSNAQIIYTDVALDTTYIYSHTVQLDLNNDGITDFDIPFHRSSSLFHCTQVCDLGSPIVNPSYVEITPPAMNAVVGSTGQSLELEPLASIDASSPWDTTTSATLVLIARSWLDAVVST